MTSYAADVAERAVGQYPISVATSLALEGANGILPETEVDVAPILEYSELWINIRTLFRNFIGSLNSTVSKSIDAPSVAEGLATEMDTIVSLIRDSTGGNTNVVFYYSNYKGMQEKYKYAVVRRDNTPKQIAYTDLHNRTMSILLKNKKDDIKLFDLKIKLDKQAPKSLILTHYPYDLLSWKSFQELVLLESHTGAIKPKVLWNTKYNDGKALSMIPFREDLLQVFGDKEHFFGLDIRLRTELIDIATKYKWSSVTTFDKLKYGIDQLSNPFAREVMASIMKREYS